MGQTRRVLLKSTTSPAAIEIAANFSPSNGRNAAGAFASPAASRNTNRAGDPNVNELAVAFDPMNIVDLPARMRATRDRFAAQGVVCIEKDVVSTPDDDRYSTATDGRTTIGSRSIMGSSITMHDFEFCEFERRDMRSLMASRPPLHELRAPPRRRASRRLPCDMRNAS